MVSHLTMTIKSSWHGYTHDNTYISEHTLALHPTMVEFMRIHGFGSRFIAEGICLENPTDLQLYMNMKINMSGQMSNMNYVGPSLTCPDNVMKEFKIGKT